MDFTTTHTKPNILKTAITKQCEEVEHAAVILLHGECVHKGLCEWMQKHFGRKIKGCHKMQITSEACY